MTRSSKKHGEATDSVPSREERASGFPEIEKLISIAQEFSAVEEETASSALAKGKAPGAVQGGRFSAIHAATYAGKQLVELVHCPMDSVSGVTRTETGWQVMVNLVELSRIPHSTDVLASYNVALSEDGMLEGYHRQTRYMRDQLGEDL